MSAVATEQTPVTLIELCNRIVEALFIDYDSTAAEQASIYINREIETCDELMDDLESGHEDSGLIDSIMSTAGIPASQAPQMLTMLIQAVNGEWINQKVTTVGKIEFFEEIVSVTTQNNSGNNLHNKRASLTIPDNMEITNVNRSRKESELTPELQAIKEWLAKQWDDNVFETYDQNLDLMKLFAIGKKQNMPNLPAVLHDVYSQWRINYLIDRKKKGKKAQQPIISDFVRKSLAFNDINQSNKQLLVSGVGTYGVRFSPQPIINPTFKIKDNLYIFVLYSYIMSEVINNLIISQSILLPLQIDFWIIPKQIGTALIEPDEDDSEDDDDQLDEKKNESMVDTSVLNIEERLKLDKDVKYTKFTADLSKQEINVLQRELQIKIEQTLQINNAQNKNNNNNAPNLKRGLSHNRLVCIADRRDQYYDFKVLDSTHEKQQLLNIRNRSNMSAIMEEEKQEQKNHDDMDNLAPIIEIDRTKKPNIKEKDEIFIFQPPREYGSFPHDYGQEHLQFLSREYMLPKCFIKQPKAGYKPLSGAYNDFDSQMFTVSFCCHSKSDIRLQWFINGWNMRLPKVKNFVKIWPEFFAKTAENVNSIAKIKENILKRWKLPIVNKEYQMYEEDLLRFQQKSKNEMAHNKDQ